MNQASRYRLLPVDEARKIAEVPKAIVDITDSLNVVIDAEIGHACRMGNHSTTLPYDVINADLPFDISNEEVWQRMADVLMRCGYTVQRDETSVVISWLDELKDPRLTKANAWL